MKIKLVDCKTILSRSRIYGVDYAVNPYLGCMHGCLYCYARFMLKHLPQGLEWGEFVYVKINAPLILVRELRKKKKGLVLLSSVTDPYQPIEKRYELTRKLLEILARRDFPLIILTKSDLIVRDLDILKKFSDVEVGLTIVTLDENVREVFEPRAPPIKKRLEALSEVKQAGLKTYAFLGPLLPFFSEESLEDLFEKFKEVEVDRVMVDKLNIKSGNWRYIKKGLEENYPSLLEKFREYAFNEEYYLMLKPRIIRLAKNYSITVDFCF
ncbi:MAG: radical SAM protein [Thermoprotei archaeon]|nr:MAG: radical SAM protein [Thermoprotei archaeon]